MWNKIKTDEAFVEDFRKDRNTVMSKREKIIDDNGKIRTFDEPGGGIKRKNQRELVPQNWQWPTEEEIDELKSNLGA